MYFEKPFRVLLWDFGRLLFFYNFIKKGDEQMYQPPIYNGYGMPPMGRQFQPQMQRVKCYPVTSYDEVKSAMIDFDGSVTVFTDFANGRIYTKNINNDGTANIGVYVQAPMPTEVDPLEARVIELERAISELKGGIENAGSYATNSNGTSESESNGTTTRSRKKQSADG